MCGRWVRLVFGDVDVRAEDGEDADCREEFEEAGEGVEVVCSERIGNDERDYHFCRSHWKEW